MTEESKDIVESPKDAAGSPEDSEPGVTELLVHEAAAGTSELVKQQREQSDALRGGARSGVSQEFGKPMFFEGTEALRDVPPAALESASGQAADAYPRRLGLGPFWTDRSSLPDDGKGRDYAGETIKREVDPETYVVKPFDTPSSIAAQKLGPGASQDQIDAYTREIEQLNPLLFGFIPIPGQTLNLPGHTTDGSLVYADRDGSRKTVSAEGSFSAVFKDGGTYARTYNSDGSYSESQGDSANKTTFTHNPGPPADSSGYKEEHTGPNPADNYSIEKTSDGHYKVKDASGRVTDKTVYSDAAPDLRVERARMRDIAEAQITDPAERRRFEQDMARFEERAKEIQSSYEKQGLSHSAAEKKAQEEVARTYHEIGKLMEAKDNPKVPLTHDDRVRLAEQFMSHAADPTTVDQGHHPTCQATTVEVRTLTTDPSKAAKLITDVSTTGGYTTPDGRTHVDIDPQSLKVGATGGSQGDPSLTIPAADGDRSHVSQIFQVTAINVELMRTGHLDAKGKVVHAPGTVHYEQRDWDVSKKPTDTGDCLVDSTGKVIGKSPDLTDDQITDMSNAITNKHESAIVLDSKDNVCGDGTKVVKIETQEQLEHAIADAKKNGKMPLVVRVDTRNPPFWHDSGGGGATDSPFAGAAEMRRNKALNADQPDPKPDKKDDDDGGGKEGFEPPHSAHVVTITDYIPGPPPKVEVDNQWGKSADHQGKNAISVEELFLAMHRSGRKKDASEPADIKDVDGIIDVLQKEVDAGRATPAEQLELLRQKRMRKGGAGPLISEEDFSNGLVDAYGAALKKWDQQKGTLNQEEKDKAETEMYDILMNLPEAQREAILNKLPQIRADYEKWQYPILWER